MRFALALLFLLLSSHAGGAKDVTLMLNDQEQQVLLSLLDLAVKQGGLRVSGNVAYFVNKIQPPTAQSEAPKGEVGKLIPDVKKPSDTAQP